MANDEPPYLTVGTDVSAKYKGAFCEAKIKKVIRVVKCKVTFKNNLGSFMVTDDLIKGSLRMGADIEAKHPEKNQFLEAVINKLQDYSQYTVVFDDGDETTLRRTSLCLKSGRHFAESPTLDQFPLTNPEHFGTPVIGSGKYKRKRRSTMNSSLDYESGDDDPFPRKLKAIRGKERDPDLGKVVAVDYGDRRKKDSWYPGLIVPHPVQSNIKISKEEHLIRSFKDGKYYQVPKRDTREFIKDNLPKIDNNALKTAVDKAVLYLEKEELPVHWDKALFMGLDLQTGDDDSQDSDSDSSDDEPSEDKDRFVAQLYKFMDERGTPINKAPSVSNKDLNLYKLFKIMHKLGGFNKVTNQNKWKAVYSKMGLPQSNANGPNQIKCAYKRYLQSFEVFYRKLGCTMVNNSRSTRGRHRSDRNFMITRTREREAASPKGRNSKDSKDKATPDKKDEEKPRMNDKKEIKIEDIIKPEEKPKSPEKKKVEKSRLEEKDDKKKKEERPRLARSQSLNKEKKDCSPKEEERKEPKPEKARTREDARKEKNESPEKKGTRSSLKMEMERKEKEEAMKEKKDQSPKGKEKKEEKPIKEVKEEKPKDKKEEKVLKDRKVIKEKKVDEKFLKDKTGSPVKEKKEDKPVREKRDSSKEPKEDKALKGRKEDAKNTPEEKSPVKKKLDRLAKEKREEKVIRPRRENKSPLPESKKNVDETDSKIIKEEKVKIEVEVKKEEPVVKEKPGPKLRERRDDTPFSEEGDYMDGDMSDRDGASQDGFDKKGPGPRSKGDDPEEPPNKGKKRSPKNNDKDDTENMLSDSDDDTSSEHDKDYKDLKNCELELGERIKVKYGRGRLRKVYDAKVLKIQAEGSEKRYFVHYNGWNNRYDEWVKRSFIVALENPDKTKLETKQETTVLKSPEKQSPEKQSPEKQSPEKQSSEKQSPVPSVKRIDRGRPPGPIVPSKPDRKNSTSSTNSSLSCSRATRSDKKNLQSSPLSSGLEPKKRTRKKSGPTVGLTDTSQDSDSDVEETIDFDDTDIGDAYVEDNVNAPNDSCFKEELFSDDEEKEKLEDVKRDDITELEKAITVEETPDDIKDPFFSPVKKDVGKTETPKLKEEIPESQEMSKNIKEASVTGLQESNKVEVKLDKEKNDMCTVPHNVAPVKTEKESKMPQSTEKAPESEKKLPAPEISVIANVNKSIIKSAKIIPNLTPPSEVKIEKSLFSSVPPKITPLLTNEQNKKDIMKSNFMSSPFSLTESSRSLSFAGLHGLIHINPFDRNLSLNKNISKDTHKVDPPKISLNSSPPKIDLKPDVEPKSLTSSLFNSDRLIPLFGSSSMLSPPELTVKNEEKPILKSSIFGFSLKPHEDRKKDLKFLDSPFKLSSKDVNKDKLEQQVRCEDGKGLKPFESPQKRIESSLFKNCILSSPQFCVSKIENNEPKSEKLKDSFDLLVENSSISASINKKPMEIKDSILSLSFANVAPKEKFIPDQPFNKVLPLSSDNICSIKPKPSETIDLSKTIPSILERLKKDVVADLKVTDSPPPQKEELNFNFLRGSQDTTKSLSRSESSNSLRICEDMSDTNDSNTDSKDLIINEKFDTPCVVSSTASDNAVPCPSENLVSLPGAIKINETPVESIRSATNIMENKDETKCSLKTSVITVASTKSPPILPTIFIEGKNVSAISSEAGDISKDIEKKNEPPAIKDTEAPKIDSILEIVKSQPEYSMTNIDKEIKSESSTVSNCDSSSSSKLEKPTNSTKDDRDDKAISTNTKIEKPINNTKVDKPVMSSKVEKTVISSKVDKPIFSTKVEKPVINTKVENPVISTKVENPVITTKVEKATVTANVEKPAVATKIEKTIITTKVEKPAILSKVEKPVITSKVEKPVINTKFEKPTITAKVEKPAITTKIEKTAITTKIEKTANTLKVEKPNTSPKVEKAVISLKVEKPIVIPKLEKSVTSSKVEKTVASPTKIEKALNSAKVEKPVTTAQMEKPVIPAKVEKPISSAIVEKPVSCTKVEKPLNTKCEKDSLFDDLLKIKNINTNFNQSSVIKWNTDTKTNVPVEEKPTIVPEEKDISPVKEEPPSTPEINPAIVSKDSEVPNTAPIAENIVLDKIEDPDSSVITETKSEPEDNEILEDDSGTSLSRKEAKKKRLGKKLKKLSSSEGFEKDDKEVKMKDGKSKSKKRARLENEDSEKGRDSDKLKSKKIKKNKNKKRLAKHDDITGEHKKSEMEDDHKDISDRIKRKEKRKNDKKFLKNGMKGEFSDSKLELKKKKGKKNRDKITGDKKDFLEKKTKKKKKPHIEENQDTDSEKDTPHKSVDKKKKKDRKKFKTKDSSSSDDAADKFFNKEQSKNLSNLPSSSSTLLRQDLKSEDPDMSFLLCEEKVPASPVGISNMGDDTSGSSSIESNRINSAMDILPLPNVYPCIDNIESSDAVNKHNIDTSAVLDNTPPTTPSSTESLLSSSPSHERDTFSINYPESTQSGRDSGEGESDIFRCNSNRTIVRGSEEYHAATTLAFAVCKSVSEKPKEEPSHNFLKRQKSEIDEHSPSKRKKKSKRVRRCSESAKSPRHKSSLSRLSKIESCCEDSSGASPAASSSPPYSNTSTLNFSRSPHRLSCSSEGFSRYNFYVPLHEKDPEKRIILLQEKMAALRKEYMELRAKVIAIDHKRRRARKKVREAGAANANPSAQSEDGQSCS